MQSSEKNMIKAKVTNINGIFIQYETDDGQEGIDDSNFYEIMNINKGDIIVLSDERIKDLKPKEGNVKS